MIGMQGGGIRLELTSTSTLEIDAADESPEMKIRRLISENPAVIFSRSSCYMCHVMKRLLSTLRVHPIVIELEDDEIAALPPPSPPEEDGGVGPVLFVGGTRVGGLERLVALHLSGLLVPKLEEAGAL